GFASRNFYVSFLAALKIDRDPQKYFGSIAPLREERFKEVRMPAYVAIAPLERALAVDPETLRDLNPALRRAVWRVRLAVPRGYELRLPADGPTLTTAMLTRRLGSQALLASAAPARRAEERSRVTAGRGQLVATAMKPVRAGGAAVVASAAPAAYYSRVASAAASASQSSIAPPSAARAAIAASAPQGDSPQGDSLPQSPSNFGLASRRLLDFNRIAGAVPDAGGAPASGDDKGEQPVSAAQADELSPSLGPEDSTGQSADVQSAHPTDYSVARNGTIQIAAAETLGHYADWLGVRAADLRRINHMRFRTPVIVGHR